MPTPPVSEILFDAANRHQIFLIRYAGSAALAIQKRIDEAIKDVERRIATELPALGATARDIATQNKSRRLRALLADLRKESGELELVLRHELSADLTKLAHMEVDLADRRINEAVGVSLNNFRPPPLVLRALVTQSGVRGIALRRWFKKLSEERFRRLEQAVRLGLIEGDTLPQIVRRLRLAEVVTKRSAESLVRTHVNHVANQAREAFYGINDDIVESLRWTSTLDSRTSDICRARDGKIYPLGSGPRPPAHVSCLPGNSLVTSSSRITGATKRWYDGNLIVIRTARGKQLACTPNHPILTDRGWRSAQTLNVSDHVICNIAGQRESSPVHTNNQHMPARIEDVAETILASQQMLTMPMPTTAEDFHGDGLEGEVAIVAADRLLPVAQHSSFDHEMFEYFFDRRKRNRLPMFSGGSDFAPMLFSMFAAASCFMRWLDHTLALFVSRVLPAPVHLFAHGGALIRPSPSELSSLFSGAYDFSLFEDAVDRGDTDAALAGDLTRRLSGDVLSDQVVLIRRVPFSGHVFNLETASGYYHSEGIIVHNCRSVMTPVLKSYDEMAGLKRGRGARTPQRLIDKQLKARGFSAIDRRQIIADARASMSGQVPGDVTYQQWLKRQPAAFQDAVLGKTRGALFRRGGLSLDQFVDIRSGRRFTLDELRRVEDEAFMKANLA